MKQIVLVSVALTAGGAERQLVGMANYWAAAGHRVTLTSWDGPQAGDFYVLDPRVERVRFGIGIARTRWEAPWIVMRRLLALRRLLAERRPEVVVSFLTMTNLICLAATAGLGVRLVISDRAHPAVDVTVGAPWRLLRRLMYRFADCVVAQTTQAREWSERFCGVGAVVIPNALRELPLISRGRENLLVGVGRLDPQKGFDILLRAFARIAARFPGWNVAILGEGPERASLLALRDQLGIGERVALQGEVRDVENWLARAGVVVQPSRYEGFPNAVLEAMGFGAAVVSANCLAGPADLIRDGVNGRLVPVEDVDALAAAMAQLMAEPELRARLGSAASEVRETYRMESVMKRWNAAARLET